MKYNENNKKYTIDNQYFSRWSSDMSYMLGYIYADGNMSKDKYRIRISSVDLEILERINEKISSNRPIRTESNSNGTWFTLVIDNKNIYDDLSKLGLIPNKSLTCEVPNVPSEYKFDFVRGYFDGDGCVYAKRHKDSSIPTLAIDIASGSSKFVKGYIGLLEEVFDERHKCSVQTRKDGLNLIRMNTTVSERLYNKMYTPNCLCLKRKREKFEDILLQRSKRKKKLPNSHKV